MQTSCTAQPESPKMYVVAVLRSVAWCYRDVVDSPVVTVLLLLVLTSVADEQT